MLAHQGVLLIYTKHFYRDLYRRGDYSLCAVLLRVDSKSNNTTPFTVKTMKLLCMVIGTQPAGRIFISESNFA